MSKDKPTEEELEKLFGNVIEGSDEARVVRKDLERDAQDSEDK